MIRLESGLKKAGIPTNHGAIVLLLTIVTLSTFLNGCQTFSGADKTDKIPVDPVVLRQVNGQLNVIKGKFVEDEDYWAVHYKVFTALIQNLRH